MELISIAGRKRRNKKSASVTAKVKKLHAINTRAAKPVKPRIESQKRQKRTLTHSVAKGVGYATAIIAGAGTGYAIATNIKKIIKFSPAAVILPKLIGDAADPENLTKMRTARNRAIEKDNQRKHRNTYGSNASLFQKALDFDVVEYFSGDSKTKRSSGEVKSLQGEINKKSKSPSSKPVKKKTASKRSNTPKKRAGAKIKVTRNGKTFYRKNPHYGK